MFQSERPKYSEQQVEEWLDYIGVTTRIAKEQCDTEVGLDFLNKLLLRQLHKVPFENLTLHYSQHKQMTLDTELLFQHIVGRKDGRGGYCMQNNLFFLTMLRSLGYKVLPVGARVSTASGGIDDPTKVSYFGLSHTVNLVYIAGKKYFCDVGFGRNCPSFAVPMEHGWTGGTAWNTFDDMHLTFDHTLENTMRTEQQKLWIYHVRYAENGPWLPMYCFTELEFLHADFEIMNYYVSHNFKSFFTYSIVIAKCILDDNGQNVGDMLMVDKAVKQVKYGRSQILAEAHSEQERVEALEKFFDIKLDPREVGGIQGYVSMIR